MARTAETLISLKSHLAHTRSRHFQGRGADSLLTFHKHVQSEPSMLKASAQNEVYERGRARHDNTLQDHPAA